MPSRRLRLWNATIAAAAITAGLGGLFSVTAVFLEGDRAKSRAELESQLAERRARCDHAYSILTDDTLNSAISKQDAEHLILDELAQARNCRMDR
jgi:hypothetical protein